MTQTHITETPLQRVLSRLEGVEQHNGYHKALCPAHDDRDPSLSIKVNDAGKVSVKCFAGCDDQAVLDRLGLTLSDLYPDSRNGQTKANGSRGKITEVYDYHDLDGNLLHQTVRYEPKGFRQRRPDNDGGGWVWSLKGVEPVLYRVSEVVQAVEAGRRVFVVEGEKDADRAREELGVVATTCPMGAKKWRDSYTEVLRGAHVVLIPDNDGPGHEHARQVTAKLLPAASSVKIVGLPGVGSGGDLSDWTASGGTRDELRELVSNTKEENKPSDRPVPPDPPLNLLVGLELTDLGNADRFVVRYGGRVKYCPSLRAYLIWDGMRWAKDENGGAVKLAQEVARGIHHEAAMETDTQKQRDLSKWAVASQSAARINAMLQMAQPHLAVGMHELDADSWLFNVKNGTIDLRTGELRPHDPADLIMKLAPVQYDPEAEAPRFQRFLRETLVDEFVIRFVQRFVGYSLTGDTRERCIAILYGSGKNGKSTLVELLLDLLGDYSDNTDVETVLAKRYNGVGNDVAALKGSRFVSTSEVEKGRRLAEGKVKALTGRDTITARFLFCEPFSFKPEFKLWMSTNNKPEIKGTDDAIWDRIQLIPFTQRFTGNAEDQNLPDELREELQGILAWAIQGCLEWQLEGLGEAEKITKATEAYRIEMDTLAAFIEDECVVDSGITVKFSTLFGAYKSWCEEAGETAEKRKGFSTQLNDRGYETYNGYANAVFVNGLGLRSDREPPDGGGGGGGADLQTFNDPDPNNGNYSNNGGSDQDTTVKSFNDAPSSLKGQNSCKIEVSDLTFNDFNHKSTSLEATQPRVERIQKTVKTVKTLKSDVGAEVTDQTRKAVEALEYGNAPRKVLGEFREGRAGLERLASSVAFFWKRPVGEGPSWTAATLEAVSLLEERGGGDS